MPARSRTLVVPPVKVTRYWTFEIRLADGLIVNTLVVVLNEVTAATTAPVETRVIRTVFVFAPVRSSLKVAVTLLFRRTPVAPARGLAAMILGAGPVRNDQEVAAIVLPATSRTPATVAV